MLETRILMLAAATARAVRPIAVLVLLTVAASARAADGEAAESAARFDVIEYRVLGSQLLPVRDVERAVYPFLGADRDLDAVRAAAASLEKVYKDAGYGTVFVDVPEQSVDDGVVRLRVTEGRIDRVRIRGPLYFSARQIRAALPALVPGETAKLPELQAQLTELNAVSGDRTVTPVLKAGRTPGTVDVDLLVKDQLPLHGSVAYDDRHTADTTPNRLTAALSYDNLWQRQHSLSLQYQTAPAARSQAAVVSATYGWRPGPEGALAELSYIHTSSNVPALSTLGVLGRGSIYNFRWSQGLARDSTSAQALAFGLDFKDVQTEVATPSQTPAGVASVATVSSPVRYLNWSATYSANVTRPQARYAANLGVGLGVRGLIDNVAQFANARYGGQPAYLYLRGSGQVLRSLPGGFAVELRLSGQWTESPLVNNEQFALGGFDTVRGYLEAESLGDSGVAGTLELHSPPLGLGVVPLLQSVYAIAFVDGGVATLQQPLPGQQYRLALRSAGIGLRLDRPNGWSGLLDLAVPQANGVRTPKGDSRIDFSVRYGF